MAIALLIVSNEGGQNSVTTIAANEKEAIEAVKVLASNTGSKFLGIETEGASKYIARAWDVMGQHWEAQKPR